MFREELYQKSVNILLDAYNEGTLEHGNCSACACGNLVAAANGYKFRKVTDNSTILSEYVWNLQESDYNSYVISSQWMKFIYKEPLDNVAHEGSIQVESTGYTPSEFYKIERAFEDRDTFRIPSNTKSSIFEGLTRVLKVLSEIHSIEPVKSSENQEKLEEIYKGKVTQDI